MTRRTGRIHLALRLAAVLCIDANPSGVQRDYSISDDDRFDLKYNAYYNVKHGWPGWVGRRLDPGQAYIDLYQRSKIGFNLHNRGKYTVGSYRLFELPANGVMQVSDGGEYLDAFFETGREIVGYHDIDDMIDKIRYYLDHDGEREEIARNAYRRVMREHRIGDRLREAGAMIECGMKSVSRVAHNAGAR